MQVSQLCGHCDVISNRMWRHKQNVKRASDEVFMRSYWYLLPLLLRNSRNKQKLTLSWVIRHSSTYIIPDTCNAFPMNDLEVICQWYFDLKRTHRYTHCRYVLYADTFDQYCADWKVCIWLQIEIVLQNDITLAMYNYANKSESLTLLWICPSGYGV